MRMGIFDIGIWAMRSPSSPLSVLQNNGIKKGNNLKIE